MKLKGGILTTAVVLIIVVYALTTLVSLNSRIDAAEDKIADLEQEKSDTQVDIDEFQYAIDNSDDDDVIEDVARDRLGLVTPNEKRYYDSGN